MDMQEISERTGFDSGCEFESESEVRTYFQLTTLASCIDDDEITRELPTQRELDVMADMVIENRWHMQKER